MTFRGTNKITDCEACTGIEVKLLNLTPNHVSVVPIRKLLIILSIDTKFPLT